MPETTLALPLSGEEVIESVVDKVRGMLRRDCFLSATTAYEAVSGSITVKLRMRDVGRIPEVEMTVPITVGAVRDEDDSAIDAVEETLTFDEQSPNEVRVEANLPVPTLTENAEGRREIKGVRYARKTEVKR